MKRWPGGRIAPLLIVPDEPGRLAQDRARDEGVLLAVADHVADRERGAHRVEAEIDGAELPEAFDAPVLVDAQVERRHRDGPDDLLDLDARLVGPREVERVGDVHAAVDEDVLAPGEDLVADLHLAGHARDVEVLRDPQVEQRDVLRGDPLRVARERRALGPVDGGVVEPREAAERAPAFLEAERKLVVALESRRDQLVLLVVQVAVVRLQVVEVGVRRRAEARAVDEFAQRSRRRRAAAVVVADEAAIGSRHAPLHAERDRRVEAPLDVLGLEGSGSRDRRGEAEGAADGERESDAGESRREVGPSVHVSSPVTGSSSGRCRVIGGGARHCQRSPIRRSSSGLNFLGSMRPSRPASQSVSGCSWVAFSPM